MEFQLAIVLSLLCLLAPVEGALTVNSTPIITSRNSNFGLGIEGTAVDSGGRVYAVGYSGGTTSGIGTIADADGNVLQELYFKDQTGSSSFNGIRFLPLSRKLSQRFTSRAIATDVLGHRVVQFLQSNRDGRVRGTTFCGNQSMLMPNDIAVATTSGRIYLSGGNYGVTTSKIGDGDLWVCAAPSSFLTSRRDEVGEWAATRLGVFPGPTNGIEISPDEKTLYISESIMAEGESVSNKVWKFDVDTETGSLSNKQLFVDFEQLDGTGYVNLDGIRVDVEGNVFVVKNGLVGEVVKLSPEGKLLLRILAPGIKETTNCDLAGPNGTTLFIVGKCVDDPDKGCANAWEGNSSPGRAWTELVKNEY